jgi:phosphopantothenoylcysteine synthetase/decarboxylase
LDDVRRLTNFSTGRLGTELANYLVEQGHEVLLLLGEMATWPGERRANIVEIFTTTADLRQRLQARAAPTIGAVFHAAAVSDFAFGRIWSRSADGEHTELHSGKISTAHSALLAELRPTPKIIGSLRSWFPNARIVGWKYEVEGDRATALDKARRQIADNRTDACVANGPAYGQGFGLVTAAGKHDHLSDRNGLFSILERWLES